MGPAAPVGAAIGRLEARPKRHYARAARLLARALAEQARKLRELASGRGPGSVDRAVAQLFQPFEEGGLEPAELADAYAQTATYGLLAARWIMLREGASDPSHAASDPTSDLFPEPPPVAASSPAFSRKVALSYVPRTAPFLAGFFDAVLGDKWAPKHVACLDAIAELLERSDLSAAFARGAPHTLASDPLVHFYELFLEAYDPELRRARGVYYTPAPIVSFMLRSVDEILVRELGFPLGLADDSRWEEGPYKGTSRVRVLDPAVGTGAFLEALVALVYGRMRGKWEAEGLEAAGVARQWRVYVEESLLPRMGGLEILVAPYVVAHFRVAMALAETGYRFGEGQTLGILLGNALRMAGRGGQEPGPASFSVIIGNPPWAGTSANMAPEIARRVEPYRFVQGSRIQERGMLQLEKNLQDDYVKFFALAEDLASRGPFGVVGLVTNNGYLEAATLRGLRYHLLTTFQGVRIVDLHGALERREKSPDGGPDHNMFAPNVGRGAAMAFLWRSANEGGERIADRLEPPPGGSRPPEHTRADLLGTRAEKTGQLEAHSAGTLPGRPFPELAGQYRFLPIDAAIHAGWDSFVSIPEIFTCCSSGLETGKDEVLTGFQEAELREGLARFCDPWLEPARVAAEFHIEGGFGQELLFRRAEIRGDAERDRRFTPFLFAPFDVRFTWYRKELLKTNSFSAARHLFAGGGRNLALMVSRQVTAGEGFSHVFVTRLPANNRAFYTTRGKVSYFPLLAYGGEGDVPWQEGALVGTHVRAERLGMGGTEGRGAGNVTRGGAELAEEAISEERTMIEARRVLAYVYAVLHSSEYRRRYGAYLSGEFPRVPAGCPEALRERLVLLGDNLVALHLLETPLLDDERAFPLSAGDSVVGPGVPTWEPASRRLFISSSQYFSDVPGEVWRMQVGGYQVCRKWLADRRGRRLDSAEVLHFRRLLLALQETARIIDQIDVSIEAAGGWSEAFEVLSP